MPNFGANGAFATLLAHRQEDIWINARFATLSDAVDAQLDVNPGDPFWRSSHCWQVLVC